LLRHFEVSMIRKPGLLLSLVLASVSAVAGNIIHVPANQPTIQAGIDVARNGDTVLVSPGTYVENIDFKGKAITVKSSNGAKVTTIDGGSLGPVVTFASQETNGSVLNGFTLTNGVGSNGSPAGGGVRISLSSPTVINNIIRYNTYSGGYGGGIGVYWGSPAIRNNVIAHNTADIGGGVSILGISTAIVTGNTIDSNSAPGIGGGLVLNNAGSVLVQNNKITNNEATVGGSGVGGGVWIVNESDEVFVQNIIVGNDAAAQGGGIYISVPWSSVGVLFLNNTIAANTSADGSGIFAGGFDFNDRFIDNIIVGNPGGIAFACDTVYGETPTVIQTNDAWSSGGTGFSGGCSGAVGTNGNISANPGFVNSTNFALKGGSPAVDMGSNTAPGLPATDFANNPRIVNGNGGPMAIVDMGAYEFLPVVLAPKSLSFGSHPVGSTTSKIVKLTNAQNKALTISSFSVPTGYSVAGCGTSVAAFTTCSLTVTFHPLTSGTFKGTVGVNDSAGNSPQKLSLSGSAP
jgi:Abnormal spindle-like microcephaly-assoc'd, ASPM-SPD-2-Hydin